MRSDVSRTIVLALLSSPSSPSSYDQAAFARSACRAVAGITSEIWWSQTGSNRRPHACKARALPAELWPRTRRRMLYARLDDVRRSSLRSRGLPSRSCRAAKVVGLGRLELPTSRLSSARSNQLSYKPLTLSLRRIRSCSRAPAQRQMHRTSASPWRVFVREERETKTAKSRQCSSTILTIVGH